LATAHWQPGTAELRGAGEAKVFGTLDELTEAMTGTKLPVAALFAWLEGRPHNADGWEADTGHIADGRLNARRVHPLPPAELRLLFEPPARTAP